MKMRSMYLSAAIFFGVFLIASGIVFGGRYMRYLDGIVTAKFESRGWKFPSKIYSDTFLVYLGMTLAPEDLRERLRSLGYRETRGQPLSRGEYRFIKKLGIAEIYLRDFHYPSRYFKGFPVRLTLQGDVISKIEKMGSRKEIPSFRLEPELLAVVYDRIWEERRAVTLAEVPPLLIRMILAIEDENFYRHWGIDPRAMLRSFLVNLHRGRVVQGGSTVTQQLMRNLFLSHEVTIKRKVKEALMACVAEWRFSKNELLENYLNEIYLGQNGVQGIFGVWAASQFYFSKEPSELTLGEIALFAGLIKAPNRYSPYRNVEAATRRRNVILAKMFEKGVITHDQYQKALVEVIRPPEPVKPSNHAPFFVDYLKRILAETYSAKALTSEGLRFFTTLDLGLQRMAEKALVEGLKELEETYPFVRKVGEKDRLEGAIVVIKPQTGEIKAMVGGRDYRKSQFNRVVQARRQPGSIFKTFVYLGALVHGTRDGKKKFTPATLVDARPFVWNYGDKEWQPRDNQLRYYGTVTFRRALERSLNSATVRIASEVGMENIRDIAYRLGIQSHLPLLPQLALGAVEVTPLEVARALSTLANNGVRTKPSAVKEVMNQWGQALEKRAISGREVISPQLSFVMNHLLRGVLDRGTALEARWRGFVRPAAGKSGTTEDAWFVGYTPDLLAVVWVGFDNRSELGLSGAEAAVPIWTEFMKQATAGSPESDFIPPSGIEMIDVDPLSGYRATSYCPRVIQEAFLKSEEPGAFCPLHPEPPTPEYALPID